MNHIKATLPNWLTYGILLIVAYMFVFLFSCTTSPLYEHYPFWFHGDSGIFQEMGVCLLKGGTPYIDLFDHKGPVLWFIQALGIMISPKWGIMALQTVFLSFSLFVWYKIILLLTNKNITSIIISVCCLFFLLCFYERGNLCEEWSLLFISFPIYLYIKAFIKSSSEDCFCDIKRIDSFLIGICIGIISMIRLNNTAPIIGFFIIYTICCFKERKYKNIIFDILCISGGTLLIILLCSVFYYIKNGWTGVYEMIYGSFIFNYLYLFGDVGSRLPLEDKFRHYYPSIGLLIVSVIICFFSSSKKTIIASVISYLVTLLAIGRFGYGHYMMILIPLFVVTIGLVFQYNKFIVYFISMIITLSSIGLIHDPADRLLVRLLRKPVDSTIYDEFHRFATSISNEERKSIYNNGLLYIGASLFSKNNIYQCNRIMISYHVDISTRLQEHVKTHGIKDLQPIWVLTQSPWPEANDEYLSTHYTLADSIPGGQFDPIWCWKRNE